MPKYTPYIAIAALIVLALITLIPIPQTRVLSLGIDAFDTHRPITQKNILGQDIALQGQLLGLGAIIVPLNHDGKTTDVTVTISQKQNVIGQYVIPQQEIKDDTFASIKIDKPIGHEGESIRVEFSTPTNTDTKLAALRFDPDKGIRLEQGKEKKGTYAIELKEKVPLWRAIYTTIRFHEDRLLVLLICGLSAIVGSTIAAFGSNNSISRQKRRLIQGIGLVVLVAISLQSHFIILKQLGGVSGGDAYNYLDISRNISLASNPFENTKRLPGYPLLLVPSLTASHGDPVEAMIVIQIISAAAIIALLPTLTQALKLPWGAGFIGSLLLTANKDFFIISLRPEAYTFYALLLLGTLILYLKREKRWQQLLFGIVLGYAAMTRQEGFPLAAALGACEVIRLACTWYSSRATIKKEIIKTIVSFLPALLLILPFLTNNFVAYGNPIFTPYFEGERLQIVDSPGAFEDAIGATWGILGSTSKPIWDELTRVTMTETSFLVTAIFALAAAIMNLFKKHLPRKSPLAAPLLTFVIPMFTVFAYMTSTGLFSSSITNYSSALILWSAILFIPFTGWLGTPLFLVLLIQILIPTWFHPFTKHYQQSFPLLMMMVGIWTSSLWIVNKKKWVLSVAATAGIIFPFFIASSILWQSINIMVDKTNAAGALDSVVYRAVLLAREYPAPYGVDQGYNGARTILGDKGYYYSDEDFAQPEKENAWLKENNIQTLVTTNANKIFKEPNPAWQEVGHFKSEGKDEELFESFVYRIP